MPNQKISTEGATSKVDPSGLFINTSDDPSAQHHRKEAVADLEKFEAEFAKTETVDYDMISKTMTSLEKHLASFHKLEPNAVSKKFDARYEPNKTKANADLAVIAEMKKIENDLKNHYEASDEFRKTSPRSFGIPEGYRETADCYCRNYDETWKHADFLAKKKAYGDLSAQIPKYETYNTDQFIAKMDNCVENGNKYAAWASTDALQSEVIDFEAKEKALKPKSVITRSEKFIEGLTRIQSDESLNLSKDASASLADAIAKAGAVKVESERYISSGEYQAHLDAIAAEKAKSVFMPKAATSNPGLESQAKTYVKGSQYGNYVTGLGKGPVASTIKAISTSKGYFVHKNDIGIPEYQYKEFVVAYKAENGICYKATVYANYTYKGGGVYSTTPNFGGDSPIQIACENVNK